MKATRRRGRPPSGKEAMVLVAVRIPIDLMTELDAKVETLGADPLARADRSALVRVLLAEAIEARKKIGAW